jgi:hypothetical protein
MFWKISALESSSISSPGFLFSVSGNFQIQNIAKNDKIPIIIITLLINVSVIGTTAAENLPKTKKNPIASDLIFVGKSSAE